VKVKWTIKNNVVSEVYFDGENIINPWGVETADSSAFFSLEENVGYLYAVNKEEYKASETNYSYSIDNTMVEGKWTINGVESIEEKNILRNLTLLCNEDSYFMDFVMRYRVRKKFVDYAVINDEKIYHKNSNKYFQYECKQVQLVGGNFDINITCENIKIPDSMKQVMYVRDAKNEWIIHIRFLPKTWNKEVIKLCNSWYNTQTIPQYISNIVLKNKTLRKKLWYHNEVSPYESKLMKFINPNAFPMLQLKKGTQLEINSSFEVIPKESQNGVSIVIPTFKRVDYLRRLLNSIYKQTYRNFEVIIVDDNSPNVVEYNDLIEEFRSKNKDIKFMRNSKNMGAPHSRNRGVTEAKYELLALVDDDDEWEPEKLEKQINLITQSDKKVGLVYTWAKIHYKDKVVGEYRSSYKGEKLNELLNDNFIPSPSVLVRKKAIMEASLFDEALPSCQDWDMWVRILQAGYSCDVVEEFLTIYNKHETQSIGKSKKARMGYKIFYRKHFNLYLKRYLKNNNIIGVIKIIKRMIW
jgi:glycosyltransferase involved in cell wall biosynthesis